MWVRGSSKRELLLVFRLQKEVLKAYLSIGPCGPGTQRVVGVMAGNCRQERRLYLPLPGPLHAVS